MLYLKTPPMSSDTLPVASEARRQYPAARQSPMPGCMREGVPVHDAQSLTCGGSVAHVTLGDQVYVLRITRAGKLILTK